MSSDATALDLLTTVQPRNLCDKLVSSQTGSNAERRSDESLLAEIGKGNKEALKELFIRYGRAVLNVSKRILRDQSEADDLRQDVFLYIFERARLYDPQKSSAASWIIQITYHRAFNRKRYLTFRHHYSLEQLDGDRDGTNSQLAFLDDIDAHSLLDRLSDELTSGQLRTLELHLFEGYSFREIAELTGESLGNVRNHYYRGIERLRINVFAQKAHGEKMRAKTPERG